MSTSGKIISKSKITESQEIAYQSNLNKMLNDLRVLIENSKPLERIRLQNAGITIDVTINLERATKN